MPATGAANQDVEVVRGVRLVEADECRDRMAAVPTARWPARESKPDDHDYGTDDARV